MFKKILIVLISIFYITPAFAARAISDSKAEHFPKYNLASFNPRALTVLTWNIDTNIVRSEGGFGGALFPDFRANARMPIILKSLERLIGTHQPDVINIQECRKFISELFGDQVDSLTPIVGLLQSMGYEVIVQGYRPAELAMSYISAYNPHRFEKAFTKTRTPYFSKTPEAHTEHPDTKGLSSEAVARIEKEIKDNNFGEFWERCMLIYDLTDKVSGEVMHFGNVHLGIVADQRFASSEILGRFLQERNSIYTGDFNTFPDGGGAAQIGLILTKGIKDGSTELVLSSGGTPAIEPLLPEAKSTKDFLRIGTDGTPLIKSILTLPDGRPVEASFIAFPFDLFGPDRPHIESLVRKFNADFKAAWGNEDKGKEKELLSTLKREILETFEKNCTAVGGILDHVFYNMPSAKKVTSVLDPTPQFGPLPAYDERTVKEYILKHSGSPAFASDHQPIVTKFVLSY